MSGFILLDVAGYWRIGLGRDHWILETWDQPRADHHETGEGWLRVKLIDPGSENLDRVLRSYGIRLTAVARAILADAPRPTGGTP